MKKPIWTYLGLSIILTLLAYSNTFQHDYNLDDVFVLQQLPETKHDLKACFSVFNEVYDEADYRPLASFTVALEGWITGKQDPQTSHKVNVFLFFLAALLLYFSIRKLAIPHASTAACIVALLFIVHPIHSNVVSSMKSRDILISFIFGMIALNLILYSISYTLRNKFLDIISKLLLFALAIGFFLLGTLAKQDIISFAFIIPLAYFITIQSTKRVYLLFRYALLIGLPFLLYRAFVEFRFQYIGGVVINRPTVEGTVFITENPLIVDTSMTSKIGVALTSIFYYLKFHLVPKGYYFYFGYDMIPTGNLFHPYNIISAIILVLAVFAFFYFLKRNKLVSFGIGFFFLSLLYALNLYMPVAGIVAPRLAFTASAGFCMLLAAALIYSSENLSRNFASGKYSPNKILVVLTTVVLLLYLPFTMNRNKAWKNIETLIEADIHHLDRSFEAQRITAATYYNKIEAASGPARNNFLEKSHHHANLAHEVYDGDQYIEETIGLTAAYMGKTEEAENKMTDVLDRFGTSESAWQVLGDIYNSKGQYRKAAEMYEKICQLHPDRPTPFISYTQAMVSAGAFDEAISFNRRQIQNDPDKYYHFEGVGYVYLSKGDTINATAYFLRAVDRNSPNSDYLSVLKDHYIRSGLEAEWNAFTEGHRPALK